MRVPLFARLRCTAQCLRGILVGLASVRLQSPKGTSTRAPCLLGSCVAKCGLAPHGCAADPTVDAQTR
eukprot:819135-Alexandrium_andersonii.AAC.1